MRGFIVAILAAAPLFADRPPNVIVIVADDLGYADLGFQGAKDIPTPHLDALAARSVICTNGYVTHPFCSPTRAGLLTGRYQQRFGHENNPTWLPGNEVMGLPLDQTTLADAMKKQGYRTIAVGKWHLGAHPNFHPNRRGFDDYFGCLGGGHHYFEHNAFMTDPAKGKQEYWIPLVRNGTPVEEKDYLTDVLAREACASVESNKAKPFFMYLAFNAPHTPLQAPAKYLDRVKGIADEKRRTYAAMVCGMDDAIGNLMKKLNDCKLSDDTLVFFFSDNGGPTGVTNCSNRPLRGAKGQVYEGGIRVPFLVSWLGKLKPGKSDAIVSSLDVFPTALAAAGANAPASDGVDLLAVLSGKASERTLFWRTGGGTAYAARKGKYKLVKPDGKTTELYDLTADIGETMNIAASELETVAKMATELEAWNKTLIPPKWQNPQPAKKAKP